MVKTFLGNIKGAQGEQGEQGEPGKDADINYGDLGCQNLIDLSLLEIYNQGTIRKFDLTEGYLELQDVNWLVVQKNVYFDNRIYNASIEDISPLNRASVSFNIMKGSTTTTSTFMQPGEHNTLDMTDKAPGYYDVRIYFSDATVNPGITRVFKPVIVEGKYPMNWSMGKHDRMLYNSIETTKFHLATLNNQSVTGTLNEPNIVSIGTNVSDTTQQVTANKITVEPGLWQITLNSRFAPVDFNGSLYIQIYLDETQILLINMSPTMLKEKSFTHVFKVTELSDVSLRVGKPADSGAVGFSGTVSNKFTLMKLGGL